MSSEGSCEVKSQEVIVVLEKMTLPVETGVYSGGCGSGNGLYTVDGGGDVAMGNIL